MPARPVVVGAACRPRLRFQVQAAPSFSRLLRQSCRRGPFTLPRSDSASWRTRGCQYTSGEFASLCEDQAVTQSMSRPGQCWDNAVAESWFAALKNELIYRNVWATRAEARRATFEYIEVFYNRRRRHSSLNYLSPASYEATRRATSKVAA